MGKTVSRADLIEEVAVKAGLKKTEARAAVDATIDCISDALSKGDKVQITGFGSFDVRSRPARTARNPRDPSSTIEVPASKAPFFKAGKGLKDAVN